MKVLVLLCIFVPLVKCQKLVCQKIITSWIDLTAPYFSKCICETGVDQRLANEMFPKQSLPNNACLKCFIACLFRRLSMMSYDNTIDYNILSRDLSGVSEGLGRRCNNETISIIDPCDKAYNLLKCFMRILGEACFSSRSLS